MFDDRIGKWIASSLIRSSEQDAKTKNRTLIEYPKENDGEYNMATQFK